jgi:hypothetical protein
MPSRRSRAARVPRSWFARHYELLALGVLVLPLAHAAVSPPQS